MRHSTIVCSGGRTAHRVRRLLQPTRALRELLTVLRVLALEPLELSCHLLRFLRELTLTAATTATRLALLLAAHPVAQPLVLLLESTRELFQLLRRARLSGPALELLPRRVLVLSGVAWLPLLIFSAFAGQVRGGTGLPFFSDIEAHVRFLIVLPVLFAAEVIVDRRLRPVVAQFAGDRIVIPEDLPAFREAIHSTLRARNSALTEVGLLITVYTLGLWLSRYQVAYVTPGWYGMPSNGRMHWTPAGYWYVFVSIPFFHFLLLRWYFRFALWFRFLWRVARLNLRLLPNHPDRAAGLGFLTASLNAFVPIASPKAL